MSGFKIDRSGTPVIKCSFPARDANTPLIARLESGEAPFRMRRDQIVSVENREIQEFARDFDADSMQPNIFRSGSTKAVAIKTGDRIATATFQFASENVGGHEAILTLDVQFVKYWIVKKRAWETSMFFKHEKYCDSLLAYSG